MQSSANQTKLQCRPQTGHRIRDRVSETWLADRVSVPWPSWFTNTLDDSAAKEVCERDPPSRRSRPFKARSASSVPVSPNLCLCGARFRAPSYVAYHVGALPARSRPQPKLSGSVLG
ncbi:hypothetical protein M758_5G104000 [Ceratodon purpureus]|nr:hypothetical protein M758_5G104000 [Ceratodon purpureus]